MFYNAQPKPAISNGLYLIQIKETLHTKLALMFYYDQAGPPREARVARPAWILRNRMLIKGMYFLFHTTVLYKA